MVLNRIIVCNDSVLFYSLFFERFLPAKVKQYDQNFKIGFFSKMKYD